MTPTSSLSSSTMRRDLTAGLVGFLVALPLCREWRWHPTVRSGVLARIVGGILVGMVDLCPLPESQASATSAS